MPPLDPRQTELLNRLQEGIPVVERPFAEIGARAGLTEDEALEALRGLAEAGLIRRVGAIYDAAALGYDSALVAMRVEPARIEDAARVVSGHPGVSHNYARDHAFNLWFTLAVPPESLLGLGGTVDRLHRECRAGSTRVLPKLRTFKIGVRLDMTGLGRPDDEETEPGAAVRRMVPRRPATEDRRVIAVMQRSLPLTAEPFAAFAGELGCGIGELARIVERHRQAGWLRRIAVTLHHRRAGYTANAMGVWIVPEDRIEEAGRRMASFRVVSHCYRRPTYPDWPYSLFTMIHQRTREECETVMDALRRATGIADGIAIYSTREFAKRRIRLFDPAFEAWERRAVREGAA